jgi:hypothetical protein
LHCPSKGIDAIDDCFNQDWRYVLATEIELFHLLSATEKQ